MNTLKKTCLLTLLPVFILACGQSRKESTDEPNADQPAEILSYENLEVGDEDDRSKESAPSTEKRKQTVQIEESQKEQGYTSSAAARSEKAGDKFFLRSANIHFKVKDVVKTTYRLEEIAVDRNGYIEKSEIKSDNIREYKYAVSSDSVEQVTIYKLSASIRLRIPANELDSALKMISPLVDKMDYRVVKADDVFISELEKKLERTRAQQSERRISDAMQNRRGNMDDIVQAEQARVYAKEQADRAYLENLKLNDKVAYSIVDLDIYQDELSKVDRKAVEKNIEEYKPGFGSELLDALANGWYVFKEIILFFVNIWFLLVIAVLVYFVYRYIKKKNIKE